MLDQRLEQLNEEITGLREQQRFILGLLKCKKVTSRVGVMNLNLWVTLLKASGFSRHDMNRWHSAFERSSPTSHQRFLEFLCIPGGEIARIRRNSRVKTHAKDRKRRHRRAGTRSSHRIPQELNSIHCVSSCRLSLKQQFSPPLQALNGYLPRKENVVYIQNRYNMLLLEV